MRFGYWFFFDQNIEMIPLIIPILAVTIWVPDIISFIAFSTHIYKNR